MDTVAPLDVKTDLDTSGLGGHPRGLTTLFFTEMWERFSYYGMRALLVLYASAAVSNGGLGFSFAKASAIYGTYGMSVYLAALPGGFVADYILGARLAVLAGGVIIALGHFSMAYPSVTTFYLGLGLIVIGTGLLKPNISAMVGGLYGENDSRRDGGFSIFYMGINIGALVAPFVCGYLAQSDGFKHFLAAHGFNPLSAWHWGFGAAGVGMTLGLFQYVFFRKSLATVGNRVKRRPQKSASAPEVDTSLTPRDVKRIVAIVIFFVFSVIFWGVYEQAGSSFNLFADRLTRNQFFGWHFPSSWYQSLQPAYVIILAPVFSWLWVRLGKREPSSPSKFAYGLFFVALSVLVMVPASMMAESGKVSPFWLFGVFFLEVIGEMCLSPVGLSTVTKLAPPKLVGMMMGVWFLSLSLGDKLAGYLGGFFTTSDTWALVRVFGYTGLVVLGATAVLAAITPWVKKLMSGVH